MADLIDRQAALEQQYLGYTRVSDTEWQKGYWEGVDSVCDNLRKLPAVDAVEVVRCKDCKHMSLVMSQVNGAVRFCTVWNGANGMGDDGYCNYGERRADNGNRI